VVIGELAVLFTKQQGFLLDEATPRKHFTRYAKRPVRATTDFLRHPSDVFNAAGGPPDLS